MIKYLIGIDEVGRGPLAGPLTICAFCVPRNFSQSPFRGIKSSKKLSHSQRLVWEKLLKNLFIRGEVRYAISSVSPALIDRVGLSKTTAIAIKRVLKRLELNPQQTFVFLDGSLKAPSQYCFQKTIIRGDEKVKIVSCASILAKERRDRFMVRIAKRYPKYSFDQHKGYGTKFHKSLIKKHGPSQIHRLSFLEGIIPSKAK